MKLMTQAFSVARRQFLDKCLLLSNLKTLKDRSFVFSSQKFHFCSQSKADTHHDKTHKKPSFGVMFDIDGVIVRGKKVLPTARSAFKRLCDDNGRFRVPCIFVTNAGNKLRHDKAKELTEWLGTKISAEQVVMSHSPLKMFTQFYDKHVLVSGQGPVYEIAQNLGFKNITTIEALRHIFTNLDMVDHKRRKSPPCGFEKYFPKIDAVILFGEPVRWETNLQLIVDVLLTGGQPGTAPKEIIYPHIPVLACNMDLFWMAEACMPRFGHGCFMLCLETLYSKITGRELKYTALVGKPSGLTYHHSEDILGQLAKQLDIADGPIRRLYCIGDNPETDIYGANLYNRHLQSQKRQFPKKVMSVNTSQSADSSESVNDWSYDARAESCESILVCTGVYSSSSEINPDSAINLNHRDFLLFPELKVPSMTVGNVGEAVDYIFKRESFS